MHKCLLFIFVFFIGLLAHGQYIPEPENKEGKPKEDTKPEKVETQEPKDPYYKEDSDFLTWAKENLFVLGDVDLNLSSFQFYFSLGPKVGYMLGEHFMVGPGIRYMFVRDFIYNENLNVFGGGIFGSLLFADQKFLVHLEYEALSLQYVQQNISPPAITRGNANLLLTGIGYRNNFGRFFYQGLLLYDLLRDPNAPYFTLLPTLTTNNVRNTLFFRVGFGFKL